MLCAMAQLVRASTEYFTVSGLTNGLGIVSKTNFY
jgi:hypothetical protein